VGDHRDRAGEQRRPRRGGGPGNQDLAGLEAVEVAGPVDGADRAAGPAGADRGWLSSKQSAGPWPREVPAAVPIRRSARRGVHDDTVCWPRRSGRLELGCERAIIAEERALLERMFMR